MFFSNPGNITDYEIEKLDDTSIKVSIFTDSAKGEHVYRISKDERHPDLEAIQNKIDNGLQLAKNNGRNIEFHEDIQRYYIFVKFPDGSQEQYTGNRIN